MQRLIFTFACMSTLSWALPLESQEGWSFADSTESETDEIDLSAYGSQIYGVPDPLTGDRVANLSVDSNVNPEELGSYLEGDILEPLPPINTLNGSPNRSRRWPKGVVPFVIERGFSKKELSFIKAAMNEYRRHTCIRFVPRKGQKDYISIGSSHTGCWSSLGRRGGKQVLNLQSPACLRRIGTAVHEMMHAIGFFHEHVREERDSYVTIYFKNIISEKTHNFNKVQKSVNFGVSYDYDSVMHYSTTAFSRNNKKTIAAKNAKDNHRLGQRGGFSPKDLKKINSMYKCKWSTASPDNEVSLSTPEPESSTATTVSSSLDPDNLLI
ncbi:PREDICTED: low choriolytic enzyme-like [Drosophila arizonae]|uniref:Metalloendopeptidase n=1 Tax=Drosophila arizonae TaxID=7263 RepID=A0ABM1PZL0_DROAR|nr:PREDICTED: low choriolytic enzyme-like [Drosophila arizonae]